MVLNKNDLPCVLDEDSLTVNMKAFPCVSLSAKYRDNIRRAEGNRAPVSSRQKESAETSSAIINRLRHKVSLEKAMGLVEQAIHGLEDGLSVEFAALDVREALDNLGEVLGETTPEDILDQIFSEFCIGK